MANLYSELEGRTSTQLTHAYTNLEFSQEVSSYKTFPRNYEHILNFVLIVDFEQANVSWVHIKKRNTFEYKIGYIMHYVVVF